MDLVLKTDPNGSNYEWIVEYLLTWAQQASLSFAELPP